MTRNITVKDEKGGQEGGGGRVYVPCFYIGDNELIVIIIINIIIHCANTYTTYVTQTLSTKNRNK